MSLFHCIILLAYLKEEPQATPLIPSYMNGNGTSNIFFSHNSILFIGMCIAILLLMILLIIVLISKNYSKKSDDKRLSTTEALVKTIDVIDNDIQTIKSGKNNSGIDNFAFEREKQQTTIAIDERRGQKAPPVINFPLPPSEKRPTSTSRYLHLLIFI